MALNETTWRQDFERAVSAGAQEALSGDFMRDVRLRYVRGEISTERAAEEAREHYKAALESAGPPF